METSGLIALLLGVFASRMINEKGYRQLTAEEKVRLMDGFSSVRAYSMIPLLLIMGIFWLLSTRTKLDKQILSFAYFGLLIAYIIAMVIFNLRKLGQLDMPPAYRQTFALSQTVSCLGIAWFFFTLFYK